MAFNRTLQHFTSSQELATVWASDQDYIVDQLVLDSDKLYRCTTAHTSGATFAGDSANWVGIKPGETIAITDGGTGQTTKTAAFDALAPTTTAGDIIVHNGTDNVRQGIGSDGQVLVVDSAQTNKLKWATIQQGSKNYIPNSTFENGVTPPTSWSSAFVSLSAGTKVPSGNISLEGSGGETFALTTSNSGPLAGTYSMIATRGGSLLITATARGFVSSSFTIDKEDQAKVMAFSFYYEASGTNLNFSGTSNNTFAIYIAEVNPSNPETVISWIQPAGVYNMTQGTGVGLASGTFQTTATGTSYRLAVFAINSITGGSSIKFDDFQLGPQKVVYGAPVSNWKDYTPTVTAGTGSITFATTTASYRRIGDSLEVSGITVFSAASAAFSNIIVSIPPELTIDSTKTKSFRVGSGTVFATGAFFPLEVILRSTTSVILYIGNSAGAFVIDASISNTQPATFNEDDAISFTFTVPISGWSSSVQMSNDTDTRVVAARIEKNGNQAAITTDVALTSWTVAHDTTSSWDSTNNKYTFPISGVFKIDGVGTFDNVAGTSRILEYRVNGGSWQRFTEVISSGASNFTIVTVNTQLKVNAGEYIEFGAASGTSVAFRGNSTTTPSWFNINRLSGPAIIAASETVGCTYDSLAAGTIAPAGTDLIYTNRIFDTHGAYSTSTGEYTVPVSGKYSITGQFRTVTTSMSVGFGTALAIKVDNVLTKFIANVRTQTTTGIIREVSGAPITLTLTAGQKIKIHAFSDTSAVIDTSTTIPPSAAGTNALFNWVSIMRVGN